MFRSAHVPDLSRSRSPDTDITKRPQPSLSLSLVPLSLVSGWCARGLVVRPASSSLLSRQGRVSWRSRLEVRRRDDTGELLQVVLCRVGLDKVLKVHARPPARDGVEELLELRRVERQTEVRDHQGDR